MRETSAQKDTAAVQPARDVAPSASSPSPNPRMLLALQRSHGNQAVGRLVQRLADIDDGAVHRAATRGIATATTSLPHLGKIQQSFGAHDVSGVKAHTGAEATASAQAMNASAFATGDHVVFAGSPDLRTAAHEAAHVVQQRAGVHLAGGVGRVGDPYERHADAVADAVVQGHSAEGLLGAGMPGGGPSVQRVVQRAWVVSNQAQLEPLDAIDFEHMVEAGDEFYYDADAGKILHNREAEAPEDRLCTLYTKVNENHWNDRDLVGDERTDLLDEVRGNFRNHADSDNTRISQELTGTHGCMAADVRNLFGRETSAELLGWLAGLPVGDSPGVRDFVVAASAGRCTLAQARALVAAHNANYTVTQLGDWTNRFGHARITTALAETAAEVRATWVTHAAELQVNPGSAIQFKKLARARAYLADGANTFAVYQPDNAYGRGPGPYQAVNIANDARTGFVNFTFVDGTIMDVHAHWYAVTHVVTSIHIKEAGVNGMEINHWGLFFGTVSNEVVTALNGAGATGAPIHLP